MAWGFLIAVFLVSVAVGAGGARKKPSSRSDEGRRKDQ